MNGLPQKFSRLITVALVAGVIFAGIADAVSRCCCGSPEPRAAACETVGAAGGSPCHPAPPPCHARQRAAAEAPAALAAGDDSRKTCCRSDRCGTFAPTEFLRHPTPPPLLALAKPNGNHDPLTPADGQAVPEVRRGFPQNLPIYLLKNAILC